MLTLSVLGYSAQSILLSYTFIIILSIEKYGPRVDSASNRNEHQESSWVNGSSCHRRPRADCLENMGASISHYSMGLHRLLQGWLYFFTFSDFTCQAGRKVNIFTYNSTIIGILICMLVTLDAASTSTSN
jgi:hypothetical protein